jgi:hypothetical protein
MRQSGLTYSGIKRYLNFLVEEEEGEEDSIKKAGNIHIHE